MPKIQFFRLSYETYIRDISIVFLMLLPLTICNAISIFFGYFLNYINIPESAEKFFYFSDLLIGIYPTALCLITAHYLSSKKNINPMVLMPYALVMFTAISLSNNLVAAQTGLPNNPLLALFTAGFSVAFSLPFRCHPLDPSRIDFVSILYKQAIHFFCFLLLTALFSRLVTFIIRECAQFKDTLTLDPLTFSGGLLYQFILGLLGSVGMNGHNFLFGAKQQLYESTQQNIIDWQQGEAALNILGQGFYDAFLSIGGSGNSLSLVICILLFSCERRHIIFALSALPLIMFNINELLLFGLPIIFNPILIVPFVIVPLVSFIVVYCSIAFEWVNPVATIVDWMTPPLMSGYLATQNSINGVILQLVVIAIGTLIYRPFYIHYATRSKISNQSIFQSYELERITFKTFLGDVNQSMDGYINKHEISKRVNNMLSRGTLVMHYQPQVHIQKNSHFAFESLVRYQDDNGKIYPPVFIRDFFQLGAIKQFDKIVIDLVLADMQKMPLHIVGRIGINISAETISDPDIVSYVLERLHFYQIQPYYLEFEITEEAILENQIQITNNIQQLQSNGIKIAIDDFGSGYASFSHLLNFDFDKVKLDRSLLVNTTEERGQKLYQLLAKISEVTRCTIVAEGIETERDKAFIANCGIDICQGYYFSKAIPLEQAIDWLHNNSPFHPISEEN